MKIEELKLALVNGGEIESQAVLDRFEVQQLDKFGNNILHYFAKNSDSIDVDPRKFVRQLLLIGLDINQVQQKSPQRSALHIAVMSKNKALVVTLVDCGIDVDIKDENGNTALWQSVIDFRDDDSFFIEYLLGKGADPNLENAHGISPLALSETIANYDSQKYF